MLVLLHVDWCGYLAQQSCPVCFGDHVAAALLTNVLLQATFTPAS
jgi:hypothetical protein